MLCDNIDGIFAWVEKVNLTGDLTVTNFDYCNLVFKYWVVSFTLRMAPNWGFRAGGISIKIELIDDLLQGFVIDICGPFFQL